MSGIWGEEQAERVEATYSALGFGPFEVQFAPGGWALLQATKSSASTPPANSSTKATAEPKAEAEGPPPPEGFTWGGEY